MKNLTPSSNPIFSQPHSIINSNHDNPTYNAQISQSQLNQFDMSKNLFV